MIMAQEVMTDNRDEALYLTYKARIYPNSEQRRAIAPNIEKSRYVHNLIHDMYQNSMNETARRLDLRSSEV